MIESGAGDGDVDLEHVGPGMLAGRYLRRFWHPIYRTDDLAAGRAKPIKLLGEQFTLYRAEDGQPHLVAYRCAHRGVPLSLGWVEDGGIRCRYHGWRYDAAGQCVEQPGEDPPFADSVRIATYPLREYVGLLFTYVGEGQPPPFRRYPDLDRPGTLIPEAPEIVPCNFWNRLENDTAHVAWTHRSTATRLGHHQLLVPRTDDVEETDYGFVLRRHAAGQPISNNHWYMPLLYHFEIRSRLRGYSHLDLWDTKFTWTVPLDDESFAAFDVTHSALDGEEGAEYAALRKREQEADVPTRWDVAERILAGELTIEEIPDDVSHYNGFVIEDYATQVGQGRIRDRTHERLGRNDAKVLLLRKLWRRELTALADGRPVADWQIPARPFGRLAAVPASLGGAR